MLPSEVCSLEGDFGITALVQGMTTSGISEGKLELVRDSKMMLLRIKVQKDSNMTRELLQMHVGIQQPVGQLFISAKEGSWIDIFFCC